MIASCNKIFIHVTTGHGLSCQTAELLFLGWALSLWPTEQCYNRANQVCKLIGRPCDELELKVSLQYFNYHSCLHPCVHFIILIPTAKCQSICSTTHKNKCEPAIIFLQALSWPRAYSTGTLLYQLTPTAASITEVHSWLQIINTEWSGHFRAGSTRLRGEDHTRHRLQVSCNQGNSTFQSISVTLCCRTKR